MFLISFLLKFKGYWQSRRNRGDFIVTFLGVVWIILNYTLNNHYIVIFGYLVILLRFCTITGIYIQSLIDPEKSLKLMADILVSMIIAFTTLIIFRKTFNTNNVDTDSYHVHLQKFLHHQLDVSYDHRVLSSGKYFVWKH